MTTTNYVTHLRITGPQGLLAVVPTMLGFHPTDSLVMLCLSDGGRLVGPVARVDLPRGHGRRMATHLAGHARNHADVVALICYQDSRRRPPFLNDVLAAVGRAGVGVLDAFVVCDGAARQVLRRGSDPLLPDIAVPGDDDPQVRALMAAAAMAGRTILPDRSALRRSIAPPTADRLREAERCITNAAAGRPLLVGVTSSTRRRAGTVDIGDGINIIDCEPTDLTDRGLGQVAMFGEVEADLAAAIAVGMIETRFRDRILEVALADREQPWLPMLISCAAWTPPALAGPLCAVLAIVAYHNGDGALAQIAIDRSLEAEPKYPLAHLMLALMAAGVPPDAVEQAVIGPDGHLGRSDLG